MSGKPPEALEQAATQAAAIVDRFLGFRDDAGSAQLALWRARTAQAQRAAHRAERRRRNARVEVPVLAGGAVLAALAGWWFVVTVLTVLAVVVGWRAATTSVPQLPPVPPPPPVLPSATRSSSAYLPLRRAMAARGALAGLVPLVSPDIGGLALETGAETERVIAGLASALVPVENAARASGHRSSAAARLKADLDKAVHAYEDLVRTVDEAVAVRSDVRLDEIHARVDGIRVAVAALSPSLPS
jgi:hypothetical protein